MSSQTVEHLRKEHDVLRKVLGSLELYFEKELHAASQDHSKLASVVDAIAESLLLVHEEKEETILLPELSRKGLSWSDGTLAHVRQDHRHGRYLLRSLRQAAREKAEWSEEEKRHVLAIAREWIEFLQRHMALEEKQLFPFLDSSLQSEEDVEVVRQFSRVDQEFDEMKDAKELHAIRTQFAEQYAVPEE